MALKADKSISQMKPVQAFVNFARCGRAPGYKMHLSSRYECFNPGIDGMLGHEPRLSAIGISKVWQRPLNAITTMDWIHNLD
jgi:hypothetical protein